MRKSLFSHEASFWRCCIQCSKMLSVLPPARLCSQQRVSSRRFVAAASSAASHRSTQAADDALGQWLIAAAQKGACVIVYWRGRLLA